jgi:hypothetical protein
LHAVTAPLAAQASTTARIAATKRSLLPVGFAHFRLGAAQRREAAFRPNRKETSAGIHLSPAVNIR